MLKKLRRKPQLPKKPKALALNESIEIGKEAGKDDMPPTTADPPLLSHLHPLIDIWIIKKRILGSDYKSEDPDEEDDMEFILSPLPPVVKVKPLTITLPALSTLTLATKRPAQAPGPSNTGAPTKPGRPIRTHNIKTTPAS